MTAGLVFVQPHASITNLHVQLGEKLGNPTPTRWTTGTRKAGGSLSRPISRTPTHPDQSVAALLRSTGLKNTRIGLGVARFALPTPTLSAALLKYWINGTLFVYSTHPVG